MEGQQQRQPRNPRNLRKLPRNGSERPNGSARNEPRFLGDRRSGGVEYHPERRSPKKGFVRARCPSCCRGAFDRSVLFPQIPRIPRRLFKKNGTRRSRASLVPTTSAPRVSSTPR